MRSRPFGCTRMSELAQLVELCRGLGATPRQAEAMARQLMKRADQLAVTRSQSREEAMAYLLRLVVEGRNGITPEELPPSDPAGKNQNKADRLAK